jgi:Ca2+-binding EF-hand superfamily protein
VDRLFSELDTNGDGKVSAAEANSSPLRGTRSRRAAAFLKTLDADRLVTRQEIAQDVERAGGELIVYRQSAVSSDNDLEVFKFLDGDQSGFLEPGEMLAAPTKILERDLDQDECVSFQEFLPPAPPDERLPPGMRARNADQNRPAIMTADMLRDLREPLLAQRMMKQYDRDGDGSLSARELGWDDRRMKPLDRNADDRLNLNELRDLTAAPVDLDLQVDLSGPDDGGRSLAIVSTTGRQIDDRRRPDVLRIAFPQAVLTVSMRQIDPIRSSIARARQGFNQIDADGNGYIDAAETKALVRFQAELFQALDADGDGKIFGEELDRYVLARAEPAATTARVNLYDTGRGFFETLDRNGDGRLSMRERLLATASLQSLAGQHQDQLGPDDPARHFHLEFVRGSFALFGPADQMFAPTSPSFEQRTPVGPVWFQRMDRNNDGDLTWQEFLGPREVFLRMDRDRDGLIDPQEASAATAGGSDS